MTIFFVDMLINKNLNLTVTELFFRKRKLNISVLFNTQYYFQAIFIRLNCTHFLIWKFQTDKCFKKLQLIIYKILSLRTLWIFAKNVLQNLTLFYWLNASLTSDNPLCFRKILLERIKKLIMTIGEKIKINKTAIWY